ncbi:hypothetical protein ACFORH_10985 [Amycolatopsis roodepoortensis]|uniref:Uncharacterized protein n=1 Tax=Amycolatopsis roodepoortensis TaxID=700274 RepID=A0ABR9LBK7_9PSEU|nr:hypothetical protein [Amycolatopsis roodepoortensis]MBE1577707.1 hypothetical protein [Amycolatopsis roodepoortensis]
MREPKTQASPFGWTATSDAEGTTVSLHDSQGHRHASWTQHERNARLQTIRLWPNRQHTVQLFDGAGLAGEASIDNGRPQPSRRRDHNGSIGLQGREYEVKHTRRWRSTLSLDGRVVALARKGRFGKLVLEGSAPVDQIDELALALFWFAVTPGRPGMIWMTFESA